MFSLTKIKPVFAIPQRGLIATRRFSNNLPKDTENQSPSENEQDYHNVLKVLSNAIVDKQAPEDVTVPKAGEPLKKPLSKRPKEHRRDEVPPGFLTFEQLLEISKIQRTQPEEYTAENIAAKFHIDTESAKNLIKYTEIPHFVNKRASPTFNTYKIKN